MHTFILKSYEINFKKRTKRKTNLRNNKKDLFCYNFPHFHFTILFQYSIFRIILIYIYKYIHILYFFFFLLVCICVYACSLIMTPKCFLYLNLNKTECVCEISSEFYICLKDLLMLLCLECNIVEMSATVFLRYPIFCKSG